jgi:hypothetical protein
LGKRSIYAPIASSWPGLHTWWCLISIFNHQQRVITLYLFTSKLFLVICMFQSLIRYIYPCIYEALQGRSTRQAEPSIASHLLYTRRYDLLLLKFRNISSTGNGIGSAKMLYCHITILDIEFKFVYLALRCIYTYRRVSCSVPQFWTITSVLACCTIYMDRMSLVLHVLWTLHLDICKLYGNLN